MPERLTRAILAAPKAVLVIALVLFIGSGIYGAGAAKDLLAGGFSDPASESAVADKILDQRFDRGGLQAVIKLDVDLGTDISTDSTAMEVGKGIVDELKTISYVQDPVLSIWDRPELADGLLSIDKSSTQIVVNLSGGEDHAPEHADALAERFGGERQGVRIRVGGQAMVYSEVNTQSSRDLAIAEGIAIPITFLVLIFVFGGVIAASLPVGIGIVAIVLTFAYLRLIAIFTDVSIYALNLATALGLALAIDYTLLLLTRYREEVRDGRTREDAIVATMATAGRTVLFSAITVALALAALVIFPMYFLRSFAYAGIGVVVVALAAALIVTPALLALLGPRVDSLDVRGPMRRLLRRPGSVGTNDVEDSFWYRIARFAMRRAVLVLVAVVALLVLLGAPFLGFKFGFPDDRVLPASAVSSCASCAMADALSPVRTDAAIASSSPAARAAHAAIIIRTPAAATRAPMARQFKTLSIRFATSPLIVQSPTEQTRCRIMARPARSTGPRWPPVDAKSDVCYGFRSFAACILTVPGLVLVVTRGRLAQLVEHCVHTAGVTGSSPVAPITFR